MDAALIEEFRMKTQQVKDHIESLVKQRDLQLEKTVQMQARHKRNESERVKKVS